MNFVATAKQLNLVVRDKRTMLLNIVMVPVTALLALALLLTREQSAPIPSAIPAVNSGITNVLVLKEDVRPGRFLRSDMFELQAHDVTAFGKHVVTSFSQVEGSFANVKLINGTPLLMPYVSESGEFTNPVTSVIPTGSRAITIPINPLTGVEGWAQPGSYVDVSWITHLRGKTISSIVVSNALILSTGRKPINQRIPDSAMLDTPEFVTLMVSIADSQKLKVAIYSDNSTLSLILRGVGDDTEVGAEITETRSLVKEKDLRLLDTITGKVQVADRKYIVKGGELRRSE